MASSSEQSETLPTAALPRAPELDEGPTLAGDVNRKNSTASSLSNASDDETRIQAGKKVKRPVVGSRKSSTSIVPYDTQQIELEDEEYDENDARTMSPRRSCEEIERMDLQARHVLIQQARALQSSLLDLVDRVESVKSQHEKLEGGNRFLQSYIGELMQTSKITSSGASKGRNKGRPAK